MGCTSAPRTHSPPGFASPHYAPGHVSHICTGTGGMGSPPSAHTCAMDWQGLGSPPSHRHRGWAHPGLPAQDVAAGATVDRRGAALGGALAAEFGSVREYCMRFEPLLLHEARAVSARCFMRAAFCIIVRCFLRATCGACNLLYATWFMLHVARCRMHCFCIAFHAACCMVARAIPTSLRRRNRRARTRRCAVAPSCCTAAWLRLSCNPHAAGHRAQVVAAELSAGNAVRTAWRVPVWLGRALTAAPGL